MSGRNQPKRRQRASYDAVEACLVEHGCAPEAARTIVQLLADAGLSPARARAWTAHGRSAYPVVTGELTVAGTTIPRRQTPIFAIEDGNVDAVLDAARLFAAASAEERFIADWFGGNVGEVRRLTGTDPERTKVIAALAERLQRGLGKRDHVHDVVQTALPAYGGKRIVDLVLEGQEAAVLDDLAHDRIDLHDLRKNGILEFHGW